MPNDGWWSKEETRWERGEKYTFPWIIEIMRNSLGSEFHTVQKMMGISKGSQEVGREMICQIFWRDGLWTSAVSHKISTCSYITHLTNIETDKYWEKEGNLFPLSYRNFAIWTVAKIRLTVCHIKFHQLASNSNQLSTLFNSSCFIYYFPRQIWFSWYFIGFNGIDLVYLKLYLCCATKTQMASYERMKDSDSIALEFANLEILLHFFCTEC